MKSAKLTRNASKRSNNPAKPFTGKNRLTFDCLSTDIYPFREQQLGVTS